MWIRSKITPAPVTTIRLASLGWSLVYIIVIHCLITQERLGADGSLITTAPSNTAALRNTTASLQCGVSAGVGGRHIKWEECASSPSCPIVAFDTSVVHAENHKYGILTGPATYQYNLQVLELADTDAGSYMCLAEASTAVATAEIIYLNSSILCSRGSNGNEVVEGTVVTTTCTVGFAGAWAPKIRFYYQNSHINNVKDASNINTAIVTLTTAVTRGMNGGVWSGEVYFSAPTGVPADAATNAPLYTDRQNLPPLNVLFPPREVDIVLEYEDTFYAGADMLCRGVTTVIANPTPEIYWVNLLNHTEDLGKAGRVQVPNLVGQPQGYACRIRNVINGTTYEVSKQIIFIPQADPNLVTAAPDDSLHLSLEWILIIALGGLLVIVLPIMITVSCLLRTKKNKIKALTNELMVSTQRAAEKSHMSQTQVAPMKHIL